MLLHYWRVYKIAFKNNLLREMIYRVSFLTMVVVDGIWMLLEMSLFEILYANVPLIAGWTKPQVFFFLGLFFLSDALFTMFFQRNFWAFSQLVSQGELDIFLLKPIHPLFLILSRLMSLSVFFNVFLGVGILLRFGPAAGFLGGWHWFFVLFWAGIGVVTAVLLRFTFCVGIFWTDRGWSLSHLYYQFFHLASKPDSMYPSFIRNLVRTVLPFAFIGSLPARALLFGISVSEFAAMLCVLGCFFYVNKILWQKGLRRYQSASS